MLIDEGKKFFLLHGAFNDEVLDFLKVKSVRQAVIMEGRPTLKTSRQNCSQLLKRDVEPILISDNMAGFLFLRKHVQEVWLAYQEKSRDGAVCEIGALILAVLAKEHDIPVRCFPAKNKMESLLPEEEIFSFMGRRVAPKGIKGYVPLLEFIPRKFIKEI